ncbi:hypothetical protein KKA53_05160 [Candidatus Dependentiae bacterium]|nr:hypothetical protein [Candidatus Dependentiae bacterium]
MNVRQYGQSVANKTGGRRALGQSAVSLGPDLDRIMVEASKRPGSESLIEELLAQFLSRNLAHDVIWKQQMKMPGHGRHFRVDCLLWRGPVRIVLEADGKDFHDARADELRDLELLAVAGIDEVWHFPGKALLRSVPATMARFVRTWPSWFRARVCTEFKSWKPASPRVFEAVDSDGSYEMPTPARGRATYYGTKRSRACGGGVASRR